MGIETVRLAETREQVQETLKHLLKDIRALERMLSEDLFETDIVRIGAEQELCLVDKYAKPLPIAMELLGKMDREKMQIMLNYVFQELRFKGDPVDYHHPDNALLHRVIDRRKGLPIMLSTVVMFLGNRLGLPFYGVNMPIHFILMYQTHDQDYLIDPFDGGSHVTYDQCCYFLKKNGIEPRPEHLERADELEILMREFRNLQQSYSRGGDIRRAEDLENLVRLTELRD